jgi:hypothetical protein
VEWSELEGLHDGETLWVLGSGPSLNYIDGAFFNDKVTVSTNFSARALGIHPHYSFSHYHDVAESLLADSSCVVTITRDTLTQSLWQDEQPHHLVLAPTQYDKPPGSAWNPITSHKPGLDQITYGSSSLHGSMHLAAHLGASHIMLVGADCGTIDGEHRVKDYPDGDKLWGLYNKHHKLMKDYLQENYAVKIYSLNPFINLNLEGHTFEGVS